MNYRMLLFSGIVTMAIGIGLGIIFATLFATPYVGGLYREQKYGFMAIGATIGFLMGVSQEAIRQLKQKQDPE
ncbi:hypothetical protein [Leptolyngbya ohadii]|uniref:hypothetical protein n=1 Tax=Leptolyngbya ohadii TaxID=1962290 RepID=UPI000B598674|nr:hypothetical protein [Leptolyngbya ohadii]